ncbi:LPXTG cell wall anchor domain-containing protein [Ferruginibacter sp.]
MIKRSLAVCSILLCNIYAFADTPGKAEMHSSKISFQGIKDMTGYTFYWSGKNMDNAEAITADTSLDMMSSHGAPFSYWFWAVNSSTKKSTDTVLFSNYYSPDYVIILHAIKNDSLYFSKQELSNANKIVSEGNTDSISNKQLVADAKAAKRGHYTNIILYSVAGLAGLAGIIWFFVRRRKKKQEEQIQGTGS